MKIEGKKFLVTGGAGFIGSNVVSELLKYDVKQVVIYDNFARGKIENIKEQIKDPRCIIFKDGGDIRDIDVLSAAIKGMDGVFHLAAMWLLHCKEYPRTAFEVNIAGTFNVLEACVNANVERLVYSSSASVYGDAIQMPMKEDHPFNNRNFYGATKISGEAMCRAFFDRYGLNYVGLRYMNVYGPNQDQTAAYSGVIPNLLNNIEQKKELLVNGDGTQAYDFITVTDAAKCNVLAMRANVKDDFYNVGTGIQTSIKKLSEFILELTNSELKITYVPYDEADLRRLVQNRIGDTEKAEKELGFKFSENLENGLKKLIEWRNLESKKNDTFEK